MADNNPLWAQQSNVKPEIVLNFSSTMKLDDLLRFGVIKDGDILMFRASVPDNGSPIKTEAHLLVRSNLPFSGRHDTDAARS